jgi:predicted N-acetyltransferase YhbS
MITYRTGNELDLDQVIELYRASTLGERRPIDEPDRMKSMLARANLVITAWDGDLMVGIARSFSDFVYVTYLADLAVRETHQRMGIGKELIQKTREAGPAAYVTLLAAPKAADYYPHIGFQPHYSAWIIKPGEPLL